ncbi:MAG: hypothetical protein SFU85_11085 [Candidatus Methylacidiphilales bacterium]|nr:hypothetical protein [Candidatus Methylacidiphilales bacterium]
MLYSRGVSLEREDAGGVRARLRDPGGVGPWGSPALPLYLDRRIAGERYLVLPSLNPDLDRLLVLGKVLQPTDEEPEPGQYAEGWEFQSVKAFPGGMAWQLVRREGLDCHRLVVADEPGEWYYAHEPALFWDGEGRLAAVIFMPGQGGQAPSGCLLEVMEEWPGKPEDPPLGMNGLLYLRSEPKPGTSHATAIAKITLEGGVIRHIDLLIGHSAAYARFPDLGAGEMEIVEWTAFLSQRVEWPCWNTLFEPKRLIWQPAADYQQLTGMLWAEEVPMHLLFPSGAL